METSKHLTSEAGSYARPPELLVRLVAGAHPDPGAGHHPPRPLPALQLQTAGAGPSGAGAGQLLVPGCEGLHTAAPRPHPRPPAVRLAHPPPQPHLETLQLAEAVRRHGLTRPTLEVTWRTRGEAAAGVRRGHVEAGAGPGHAGPHHHDGGGARVQQRARHRPRLHRVTCHVSQHSQSSQLQFTAVRPRTAGGRLTQDVTDVV